MGISATIGLVVHAAGKLFIFKNTLLALVLSLFMCLFRLSKIQQVLHVWYAVRFFAFRLLSCLKILCNIGVSNHSDV